MFPAELVRKNRLWKGHLRAHVQQKRHGALHWVWQGRFGWKLRGIEGALSLFERGTCNRPFLCFLPRPFCNEFFGLRLLNIAQAGMRFFMRRSPCRRCGSSAVPQAFAVPAACAARLSHTLFLIPVYGFCRIGAPHIATKIAPRARLSLGFHALATTFAVSARFSSVPACCNARRMPDRICQVFRLLCPLALPLWGRILHAGVLVTAPGFRALRAFPPSHFCPNQSATCALPGKTRPFRRFPAKFNLTHRHGMLQ